MIGATMTGAQAVVECLRREGVGHAFCVPGESYLGIIDALYHDSQMALVTNRHEGGAAFAAEAYAKVTGKPGVCLVTRGPGASNASIGVHVARQDSVPMVLFVGQVSQAEYYRESVQEVDVEAFFRPIAKWAIEIRRAERVPELVQRAFHVAKSGRPGPVVVSLPEDVLTSSASMYFADPCPVKVPEASAGDVRGIVDHLCSADKVVIVAGAGVSRSKAHEELVELSERLAAPVFAGYQRQDVFPNNHPHYFGQLGGFEVSPRLRDSQREIVAEADVVLAVGTRLGQDTVLGYTLLSPHHKLIHIDVDPSVFGVYRSPRIALLSDARKALRALIRATPPPAPDREARRREWVNKGRRQFEALATPAKFSEERTGYAQTSGLVEGLAKVLPKDAIVTVDSGNFQEWVHRFYKFERAGTFVGISAGAMGYGLPAAIAAKLSRPEQTVVSISGDGGFMMTVQELETAIRHGANCVCVVINNNMYGSIRMEQELRFPGRVNATTLTNPNLAELAESFGAHGEQVRRTQDFVPALRRALASDKPAVVEVLTDPEQITVDASITEVRAIGSETKGEAPS
jgi:acetolactate synthase-1/2/3 large subunit